MLGIEDYGSDSDNASDHETRASVAAPKPPSRQPSTLSLPPPKSGLNLPPAKTERGPKKITIGLPNLPAPQGEEDDDLKDERRDAKRPRLESSAGRSSLLSMLPAPKAKAPVPPAPERVLGGGKGPGLVFNAPRPKTSTNDADDEVNVNVEAPAIEVSTKQPEGSAPQTPAAPLPFLPPSLKKGRVNVSLEDDKAKVQSQPATRGPSAPAVDFFSLGASSSSTKITTSSMPSSSSVPATPSLSSAPALPTFEPPEPSQTDEYPGYYQLPNGTWAAHDPVYYAKFVKKWQAEYDAHVRALEKGAVKGFEGYESAPVEEVNAMKEMEKAKREIKEREERKALTLAKDGPPPAPRMTLTASKTSGIARSRHQLSTLLKEAYENREALEEKIAQGKRNRKEAGNKYGF
ncbi:putative mitotic checkpoint regulator, MAD2B-interacting [Lyophyllum shimeji]|uniref:Mitotic checkpoint regulator, MAD2B-interacting n=1 Tax=Lyophyllum shimeji TaxID=47721 RepID=A0A9P3UL11_LYOSH|nr:putative mitotic checkpoint regulator, MAD2B-interacting [Lyophyllum shimeji]